MAGVMKRWNIGSPSRSHHRWSVRFIDPATGATRYRIPEPLQVTILVSPDGRLVAATLDDEAIEVWDAEPSLRWPTASIAGLATTGILALISRWRRRKPPSSA